MLLPAGHARHIRRRHDEYRTLALAEPRQRGQQQRQLADAIDRQQDFRQCRIGPAAGGKRRVQRQPSGRLVTDRYRHGLATPDLARIEQARQGNQRAHIIFCT